MKQSDTITDKQIRHYSTEGHNGLDARYIPDHLNHFVKANKKSKEYKEDYNKTMLAMTMFATMVHDDIMHDRFTENSELLQEVSGFFERLLNGSNTQDYIDNASPEAQSYINRAYISPDEMGNMNDPANFDLAVRFVLEREGYLSNHRNDKGGLTKYGISQKANPDIDVANLSKEDAIAIYKDRYWDAIGADNMDMATALVAFDAAVNHGVGNANKMLAATGGDVNSMLNWRLNFYDRIVENNPSQSVFLKGWNNRIGHLQSAILEINQGPSIAANGLKPSELNLS